MTDRLAKQTRYGRKAVFLELEHRWLRDIRALTTLLLEKIVICSNLFSPARARCAY